MEQAKALAFLSQPGMAKASTATGEGLYGYRRLGAWSAKSTCRYLSVVMGGSCETDSCFRVPLVSHCVLVICSRMLSIKNKTTQLLIIRDIRLSKHCLSIDIMIIRRKS
jgi:hypothetical protein